MLHAIDRLRQSYTQVLTGDSEFERIFNTVESTTKTDEQIGEDLKQQRQSRQIFVLGKDNDAQLRFQ